MLNNNNTENWTDFALGEDVRDEQRLLQDEMWRDAVADGRNHVSHREYSNTHGEELMGAISDFEIVADLMKAYTSGNNLFSKLSVELLKIIVEYGIPGQGSLVIAAAVEYESHRRRSDELFQNLHDGSFRITARCRPLLDFDYNGGAYSCATTNPVFNQLVIHEGTLARNGRRLTMNHKKYQMHKVWSVETDNHEICQSEIEPLICRARLGYSASLICFGQTGINKY